MIHIRPVPYKALIKPLLNPSLIHSLKGAHISVCICDHIYSHIKALILALLSTTHISRILAPVLELFSATTYIKVAKNKGRHGTDP